MSWDSDWLHRISGGYEDNKPKVTQADLQRILKERPAPGIAPGLTGHALAALLLNGSIILDDPATWAALPPEIQARYDRAAEAINARYVEPAVGVPPATGMAMAEIMTTQKQLLIEWYHYSIDPEQSWKREWELREKTEELLGKDVLGLAK